MISKWIIRYAELFLRRYSRNFQKSFSLLGIRFITPDELKTIFPDSIREDGMVETHFIPALMEGQTVFFLDGAEAPQQVKDCLRAYSLHLKAPFTAYFRASEQRRLFVTGGCLLICDAKLGKFFICPEFRSPDRFLAAFRKVGSKSIASLFTVTSQN